jgi:hypothetical protein
VIAMIEYFTAGIAVHLRKNFNMTLHSAAPRPRGNKTPATQYTILHCEMANRIRHLAMLATRKPDQVSENKRKIPGRVWRLLTIGP